MIEDDDIVPSNEEIIENLPEHSQENLCEIIVASRYLGYNQEVAKAAMKELANRRSDGSDFDFESFIEIEMKKLPSLNSKLPDLKSIFSGALK